MSANKRSLRSTASIPTPSTSTLEPQLQPLPLPPLTFNSQNTCSNSSPIKIIPPGSKLPGLSPSELTLLHRKQTKLASTVTSTYHSLPNAPGLLHALASTLIFAQHEAGTAICIDPAGWILTCAHCFGDDETEYQADSRRRWLLFYTGLAVQVECRVWDPKRDLALLKIVAVETDGGKEGREVPAFRHVCLSSHPPAPKTPIICIGQPGRDDLESSSARRTRYNLIEVSEGAFRGMVRGVDPQDNSEIGTLMHDAWTYWGHSGAPLLTEADGNLVGLHSSWDDQTLMRHGVPLAAMREFLSEHLASAKARGGEDVADEGMALDTRLSGLR